MSVLRAEYMSLCTRDDEYVQLEGQFLHESVYMRWWICTTRRLVSSWVDKRSDPSQIRADYSHLPKQKLNILKAKGILLAKMEMPDSQSKIFIRSKLWKISAFFKVSCSRNAHVTFEEKPYLKKSFFKIMKTLDVISF